MESKLSYFYNIGAINAKKIIDKLLDLKLVDKQKVIDNIYTNNDLRLILLNKKIFGELPIATQYDLVYRPIRIIPRHIIILINRELYLYIKPIQYIIAGSFIRGKTTSSDIDLVIINDNNINISDYLINTINKKSKCIKFHKPFATGPHKITTLIEVNLNKTNLYKEIPEFINKYKSFNYKINVKVDIFLTTSDNYIFTLLFATGSGIFNIRTRMIAKKKGYKLNQDGLWLKIPTGYKKIKVKSELDLFKLLDITYVSPENRN